MANEPVEAGKWYRAENCIYELEHVGWKKGVEQFRNRFSIWVQNDSGKVSAEEIEAISRKVEAIPDILVACRGLLEHVRSKHNLRPEEPFQCEHMRAIEAAVAKAEGKDEHARA